MNRSKPCRSYYNDASALYEPVEGLKTWNIVRFRLSEKETPDIPRNMGFMPGIVIGVNTRLDGRQSLIVMPIIFLPEYEDYNPQTEQKLTDTAQMRSMGLVRDDPRLIRTYVRTKILNGEGFLSSATLPDGHNLRSVPKQLASVITGKFKAAIEERAVTRARTVSGVYEYGADSPGLA